MLYNTLSVSKKTQNCPFFFRFRHPTGGGSSHGHRQHAQKLGKDRACGSGDIFSGRQTDTETYSLQYFATASAGEIKNKYNADCKRR